MNLRMPSWFLALLAVFILVLPPIFLFRFAPRSAERAPFDTVKTYIKSAYARDFKKAYRFISLRDRQLKTEAVYVRENGPFNGFSLDVTRKLSEFIEMRPLETVTEDGETRIKVDVQYPDANSLSSIVLDWDEERLNALPPSDQRNILATLDKMQRAGQIRTIEGEEEFKLIKEGRSWQVYFDWAAGVRVSYSAVVPPTAVLHAVPVNEETTIRPNELFTIAYRVKNRTGEAISTRIIHRIEPEELRQYLDIVDCALLLPVQLSPGQESEFSTTYMVRGDLPEGTKELNVTYEFQVTY
ncbi:MAG: hypothetical protein GEU77_15970 [Deltaproteobacteria bacterium]|nr:hypothetical protein [Deltaproteobacteria bacterium]